MAVVPFNQVLFCVKLKSIVGTDRSIKVSTKLILNNLVFSKRHELDPQFSIPAEHIKEWNEANDSSGSDSGVEEMDDQLEILQKSDRIAWINGLIPHIEAVFASLVNVDDKKNFAIRVADQLSLTVKQRKRLTIAFQLHENFVNMNISLS